MHLKKFLKGRTGKIFISIILGLGLSTIFKVSCDSNNCVVIQKSPDFKDKKIIKYNKKCYEPIENMETCNEKKKIINV
uniref:Uncharacterized protein n=1 Tax=viral metagenome TaxID=1070528 RepID=A0A6C0JLY0_9ZZZZ